MPDWQWNAVVWGNTLISYVEFFAVVLTSLAILWFVRRYVNTIAGRSSGSPGYSIFFTILRHRLYPLGMLAVIYFSFALLKLSPYAEKILHGFAISVLVWLTAASLIDFTRLLLERSWSRRHDNAAVRTTYTGVMITLRVFVWTLAFLFLLDNLGVEVSGLLAGIGIGGVAIALASQAFLGDVFSYFTVYFDRSVEIDDFISIDDFHGTVENVGLKSIRLRSLDGEEIVFSNTDLASARIRNFKRMKERRVKIQLDVVYSTPVKKLKAIPGMIESIVSSTPHAIFNRTHFFEFAESSLRIEIIYFVDTSDFMIYMDTRHEINLKIKEAFEKAKIEFAFPTQTHHISRH